MTNTDLINDYLDNELSDSDRTSFEEQLKNNPDLQNELQIHKDIIEGVRNTRKMELKAMLNKVPVGNTPTWTTGKIISGIAIVAVTAITLYYLFDSNETGNIPAITDSTTIEVPAEQPTVEQDNTTETIDTNIVADEPSENTDQPVGINEDAETPVVEKQPEVKKPVVAPTFEANETERTDVIAPGGAILGEPVTTSTQLDVSILRNDNEYNFHYTFENSELSLYGDFDDDLYEILEFNSNEGAKWFLSYQGKYYYLNPTELGVMPLEAIRDQKLLSVLKGI